MGILMESLWYPYGILIEIPRNASEVLITDDITLGILTKGYFNRSPGYWSPLGTRPPVRLAVRPLDVLSVHLLQLSACTEAGTKQKVDVTP